MANSESGDSPWITLQISFLPNPLNPKIPVVCSPLDMRFGPAYHEAKQMQDILFAVVCDEKTPAKDAVGCVKAWINLEKLKREIRGIPPLAPAKLSELPLKCARRLSQPIEPVES